MITPFKRKLKKLLGILIILFIVLFVFRLIHGYTKKPNDNPEQSQFFESISNYKRNIASKKYRIQSEIGNQNSGNIDQKYEKIAEIRTKSSRFDNEEKFTRNKIKKYNALIQFEQKSGNKGYRKLNLVIGVPPENFDSLYAQLIKIGKVQAKQITKKDKTNEYKELNAKKESLEKIRNSLIELKNKGGKIEEYMDLEFRILDIEQQLQTLGVSLGDFDDENEFCTVQFSILEGKETKITTTTRIKVALEWTIKIYLQLIATLVFIVLFAYFLLKLIDKFNLLKGIVNK